MPKRRAVVAAAALALAAQTLAADDKSQASAQAPTFTINGFVSAAYSYNVNRPASGRNQVRVFDFDDERFKLDVAELVVQRAAAKPGELGFRLDLTAGSSVPKVTAASGLFRDAETGVAENFDLQQGFVSYVAPLGSGLRFDAGKRVTHAGAELIEGYDGYNDNYTRSFLFGYAIPFTHTGVWASYALGSKATLMGMLATGWDNVKDNNLGKTLGGQLALLPTPRLSLFLNYIGGPERKDSADRRDLFDGVVVFKPVPRLALTANYAYARERNAVGLRQDGRWNAIVGYARVVLHERIGLIARAERFEDENGVRTGTAQVLQGFTGTTEWKLGRHFVLRQELRHDTSNESVFEKRSGRSDAQTTAAFNAIYVF